MNMKYGRLFRGDVEYAPDSLEEKDGTIVSNPSAATYLAAGWKRVVDEPPAPVPGCTVCPSGWDEGEDAITRVYKQVPGGPTPAKPRVFSKLKLVAALKNYRRS